LTLSVGKKVLNAPLRLAIFQKTRVTLSAAKFRELLAADGSGFLTLRKTISHGNSRWQVSFQIDGRRRRRFFKSKAEAQAWLSELRWQSPVEQFWQSLTPIERQGLMLGYQLKALAPLDQGDSPRPVTLAQAVACYVESRNGHGLRPNSFEQIRRSLRQLSAAFTGKHCHEITTSMIEGWFRGRGWKRSTVDGVIAKIGPFFTWCVREKFAAANPVKGVIKPKADESEPCILSPGEVGQLMAAAKEKDAKLIPYLALGLFAGIRPEEIMRLDWQDISAHGININGRKAKTRQRRLVTVADNLGAWLKLGGELPPKNRRRRLNAVREAAGITWGHDIMRHTFASYHLAHHGSPDKTAHELGHRDTQMLYRHYRQLVTREAAEAFWDVLP
jgi:integrase